MINTEAYIAGCLLIDGDEVVRAIQGIITRDDFTVETYKAVFSAALVLSENGTPIDPVSLREAVKREGVDLPDSLIVELMEIVPTTANAVEYAHRMAEEARTRRIKELAAKIQDDIISTPDELLSTLQQETEAIRGSDFQRGLLSPSDTLHRFNAHVVEAGEGRYNFIPSGYKRLDEILSGGFIRGGLYLLAARPAVGKSTFAVNLADNIQGNCLLVSLEMTPEQVTSKRVSRLTGISSARLLSGDIDDDAWTKVSLASSALYGHGVYMNTRYDLTVNQIKLLAQSVPELKAIIIDYLGLIKPATPGHSLYESVSQISRDLKTMAVSLDVPVICLAQLSRAVEGREDKHPRLSDLRDSGSLEQDADAVMFLYRPDYYTGSPDDGRPSLVELDTAKNRHGQTGKTEFSFWMSCSTFKEVS